MADTPAAATTDFTLRSIMNSIEEQVETIRAQTKPFTDGLFHIDMMFFRENQLMPSANE